MIIYYLSVKKYRNELKNRLAIILGLDGKYPLGENELTYFIEELAAEELPSSQFICFIPLFRCYSTLKAIDIIEDEYDVEYEEVFGYGTPRLSGFAGIKITL